MVKSTPQEVLRLAWTDQKVLDLNTANTVVRTCSIAAFVPPNTRQIQILAERQSGTGGMNYYPASGNKQGYYSTSTHMLWLHITSQELKLKQSVSGDDWDIYILAYITQGRLSEI